MCDEHKKILKKITAGFIVLVLANILPFPALFKSILILAVYVADVFLKNLAKRCLPQKRENGSAKRILTMGIEEIKIRWQNPCSNMIWRGI